MFKYFTLIGQHKWLDILPDLTESYNNTTHRSIKMAPNQVTSENEALVRATLYPRIQEKVKSHARFSVDDTVRVSRKTHVFAKGYRETYSHEIFYVSKIKNTNPITYTLKSFDGEEIKGSWYESELQKVDKSNNIFPIERIIKSRTRGGKRQLLVHWKGYPDAADSWVQEEEIFPVKNASKI